MDISKSILEIHGAL